MSRRSGAGAPGRPAGRGCCCRSTTGPRPGFATTRSTQRPARPPAHTPPLRKRASRWPGYALNYPIRSSFVSSTLSLPQRLWVVPTTDPNVPDQLLGLEGESWRRREARQCRRTGVEQRPPGGDAALLHHELGPAQHATAWRNDGGQPAAFGHLVEDRLWNVLHGALDQDHVLWSFDRRTGHWI